MFEQIKSYFKLPKLNQNHYGLSDRELDFAKRCAAEVGYLDYNQFFLVIAQIKEIGRLPHTEILQLINTGVSIDRIKELKEILKVE